MASRWKPHPLHRPLVWSAEKPKGLRQGGGSEAGRGAEQPSRRGPGVSPLPAPSASCAEGEGDSGSCAVSGAHVLSCPGQAPSVTPAACGARVVKKKQRGLPVLGAPLPQGYGRAKPCAKCKGCKPGMLNQDLTGSRQGPWGSQLQAPRRWPQRSSLCPSLAQAEAQQNPCCLSRGHLHQEPFVDAAPSRAPRVLPCVTHYHDPGGGELHQEELPGDGVNFL